MYRDEEYVLVFWREVLQEYFSHVQQKITAKKSDLIKAFTLHNRRPAGLSAIIELSPDIKIIGLTNGKETFCQPRSNIIRGALWAGIAAVLCLNDCERCIFQDHRDALGR